MVRLEPRKTIKIPLTIKKINLTTNKGKETS